MPRHGAILTSAGRSRMETISRIRPCPLFVLWPWGDASAAQYAQMRRQLLLQHARVWMKRLR